MACYCGVCAVQLGSATENFGGFRASLDFRGWQTEPERSRDGHVVIMDTCEGCATALRAAVAEAANRIVKKHAKRVKELHEKMSGWERERREREEFDRKFEARRVREWHERQGKKR